MEDGLAMKVRRMYIPDSFWLSGYIIIPVANGCLNITWPLPRCRVYEIVPLGETTYIFLRASAFIADSSPEREGETPTN